MRAEIIYDHDLPVMVISIPESYSVVATASGKLLKRRLKTDGSPEVVPMYPYEIYTRLSDLRKLDFSAQPVQDGTVDDLDPNQIVRLRETIQNQNGDQQLLSLSDEDLGKGTPIDCASWRKCISHIDRTAADRERIQFKAISPYSQCGFPSHARDKSRY